MSLPPEYEKCLQKHTNYLDMHMVPDGVFVYLSGAKITDDEDKQKYYSADGDFYKNHTIVTIVAKHGRKGFEAFLEALKITGQGEISAELEGTLQQQYSNVGKKITKIKNNSKSPEIISSTSESTSSGATVPAFRKGAATQDRLHLPGRLARDEASPRFIVGSTPTPRPSRLSFPSSSPGRTVGTARTPLTPPLTEEELVNHLERLKNLLAKIGSTHTDFRCRQEAQELRDELDEAGQCMLDRVHQLSAENAEKDSELRRAKYMVRGLEIEIQELKTKTADERPTKSAPHGDKEQKNKSKLCVVL